MKKTALGIVSALLLAVSAKAQLYAPGYTHILYDISNNVVYPSAADTYLTTSNPALADIREDIMDLYAISGFGDPNELKFLPVGKTNGWYLVQDPISFTRQAEFTNLATFTGSASFECPTLFEGPAVFEEGLDLQSTAVTNALGILFSQEDHLTDKVNYRDYTGLFRYYSQNRTYPNGLALYSSENILTLGIGPADEMAEIVMQKGATHHSASMGLTATGGIYFHSPVESETDISAASFTLNEVTIEDWSEIGGSGSGFPLEDDADFAGYSATNVLSLQFAGSTNTLQYNGTNLVYGGRPIVGVAKLAAGQNIGLSTNTNTEVVTVATLSDVSFNDVQVRGDLTIYGQQNINTIRRYYTNVYLGVQTNYVTTEIHTTNHQAVVTTVTTRTTNFVDEVVNVGGDIDHTKAASIAVPNYSIDNSNTNNPVLTAGGVWDFTGAGVNLGTNLSSILATGTVSSVNDWHGDVKFRAGDHISFAVTNADQSITIGATGLLSSIPIAFTSKSSLDAFTFETNVTRLVFDGGTGFRVLTNNTPEAVISLGSSWTTLYDDNYSTNAPTGEEPLRITTHTNDQKVVWTNSETINGQSVKTISIGVGQSGGVRGITASGTTLSGNVTIAAGTNVTISADTAGGMNMVVVSAPGSGSAVPPEHVIMTPDGKKWIPVGVYAADGTPTHSWVQVLEETETTDIVIHLPDNRHFKMTGLYADGDTNRVTHAWTEVFP